MGRVASLKAHVLLLNLGGSPTSPGIDPISRVHYLGNRDYYMSLQISIFTLKTIILSHIIHGSDWSLAFSLIATVLDEVGRVFLTTLRVLEFKFSKSSFQLTRLQDSWRRDRDATTPTSVPIS